MGSAHLGIPATSSHRAPSPTSSATSHASSHTPESATSSAWGAPASRPCSIPILLTDRATRRHDWGTSVCFQLARQRPDLALAVLGSIIPYLPNAGPYAPISALVPVFPELAYQVFLGETPKAAADELDRDVRRSLRATLRTVASPPPEGFLTDTHSFLSAYADIAEVRAFAAMRGYPGGCQHAYARSRPSRSSRKRKRTTGSSNIASRASITVRFLGLGTSPDADSEESGSLAVLHARRTLVVTL